MSSVNWEDKKKENCKSTKENGISGIQKLIESSKPYGQVTGRKALKVL